MTWKTKRGWPVGVRRRRSRTLRLIGSIVGSAHHDPRSHDAVMSDLIPTLSVLLSLALPLAFPRLLSAHARIIVVLIAPACLLLRPDMRR